MLSGFGVERIHQGANARALQPAHPYPAGGAWGMKLGALRSRAVKLLGGSIWFLFGMAVVLAAIIVAWWSVSSKWSDDTLGGVTGTRASAPLATPFPDTEIDRLRENLANLNERMQLLTDSVNYLENKLIRAHVQADSILKAQNGIASSSPRSQTTRSAIPSELGKLAPPAAGAGKTTVARDGSTLQTEASVKLKAPEWHARKDVVEKVPNPGATHTTRDAAPPKMMTASARHADDGLGVIRDSAQQSPAAPTPAGPWAINLASLASQGDADRFTAKARSRGIQTVQQEVVLKGKKYWRVQIAGFATSREARAHANTVMRTLGVTDVWVTQH